MFILKVDLLNIAGVENKKGISQTVENPDLVLLKSLPSAASMNYFPVL